MMESAWPPGSVPSQRPASGHEGAVLRAVCQRARRPARGLSCPVKDNPVLPAPTCVPSAPPFILQCGLLLTRADSGVSQDRLPLLGSWEDGSCGHQSLETLHAGVWSLQPVTSTVRRELVASAATSCRWSVGLIGITVSIQLGSEKRSLLV